MQVSPSPHFTAISLAAQFNCKRVDLPKGLESAGAIDGMFDSSQFRGIPFLLGSAGGNNVILLDQEPATIDLQGVSASYLVFVHVVEEGAVASGEGIERWRGQGNESGQHVSDYILEYENGERVTKPILRRFAIQERGGEWGASGFACIPCDRDTVFRSTDEDIELGSTTPSAFGRGETRTASGRDSGSPRAWLYALRNPQPDQSIRAITLNPCEERSAVYGLAITSLPDHPLRYQPRRKMLATLPKGVAFNAIDEIDNISLDLGTVISARRQQVYDHSCWNVDEVDLQPVASEDRVVVEYSAHPAAILHIGTPDGEPIAAKLQDDVESVVTIAPAYRPVTVKVCDKSTGNPVGVRIHFHGEAGEYLPPKGYHRKVNRGWFEDNYGEFANHANQYAYIRGECVVDLPLGKVYVEITRGYEITPVRESFDVTASTSEITFELERVLDWRSKGWVSADTHVHFLTPSTAVLEGEAEDVNVVNLLASQWGEMFSNVSDFDGATTHSNTLSGNNGEFLARVGTENRMQTLGHISLLGYSGAMIHPLCSGGPSESAIGDFQEVTMAEWAERCIAQNGLVVMPHAPNPQLERVADVVLDLVHAIEFMSFNPFDWQLLPTAVADWYRFLNVGYHLPIVGGSDKMSASSLLGGIRTYAHLGETDLTYENWMSAVRSGHTFVTVGPLVDMQVEGEVPGQKIALPESGGTINVSWRVESIRLPVTSVEVVVGGRMASQESFTGVTSAEGTLDLTLDESSWIAVRVRGTYNDKEPERIAAHTSAVQVLKGDAPVYKQEDAVEMLRQIEGAIAYVDTVASRPDADRYRKMQLTLESAYNRLHQRMHQQGVFHQHTPLHEHGEEH